VCSQVESVLLRGPLGDAVSCLGLRAEAGAID
jgi:hypothetical protein